MMNMADPVAINVKTLRIDSGIIPKSSEKEFNELLCMNP